MKRLSWRLFAFFIPTSAGSLSAVSRCFKPSGFHSVPSGTGSFNRMLYFGLILDSSALFGHCEDYDTVPVVGLIDLSVGACGFKNETLGVDSVVTYEDVGNGLCAAL